MENVAKKIVQKGEAEMTYYTHKKKTLGKEKNNKDMHFMALSIKCDSLALRTESREEWIFSSGINCMSVCEWLASEKESVQ